MSKQPTRGEVLDDMDAVRDLIDTAPADYRNRVTTSVTALVAAYERALGNGETTVVVGDLVLPTAQLYDYLADPTTYIGGLDGRYVPAPPSEVLP